MSWNLRDMYKGFGLIPLLLWNKSRQWVVEDVEEITTNARNSLQGILGTSQNINIVNTNNQTNYVNNYQTTINKSSDTTIINNFSITPTRRQPPSQINYPDPVLPTDIDNQTPTKTNIGSSISVSQSLITDRTKNQKLIHNPLSLQREGKTRSLPQTDFTATLGEDFTKAIDARENNPESIPGELGGYLIGGNHFGGIKGEGAIFLGIKAISTYAQMNRMTSSLAFIEPLNTIPITYTEIQVDDEYLPLTTPNLIQDTTTTVQDIGEVKEIVETPIWELLGYKEGEYKNKSIEDIIKDFGKKIYDNKPVKSLKTANDVLFKINDKFETKEQFIAGIITSLFYRGGFHRLPGELPETLTLDTDKYPNPQSQPTIFVEDMMEYQEYLIRNLDAIFGRFPINFTYKSKDDNGNDVSEVIKFDNIAECLLEMAGLIIDINNNTDINTNIGLKNLAQTMRAVSGSSLASDFGKTIMDCLGFNYDEFARKITIPVTPDADTLLEFLKDSEVEILGVKKPWLETDVKTLINKVTVYSGIAAAALGQKENFITGDAIRDVIKNKKAGAKDKYDKEWEELLDKYNNKKTNFPKAKLKDKSTPNIP
ncbi:hypothetical protein VKI21_06965 [Cyanobacterium aponinum UTEX 3222]|uniref:hypothetical protein n=1 Tax=Cyanobacterium aponinum TaxID=379064 RepID=UPI0030919B39|nr:hypothetical protein VKI21_06965 [Cyanobacterium aponinum UTEX 3222]